MRRNLAPRVLRPLGAASVAAGLLLSTGAVAVASTTAPSTPSTGGGDRGDVWVSSGTDPAGRGHENDPHLGCGSVAVWSSGLGARTGNAVVDGWAPSGSGSGDQVDTFAWTSPAGSGAHLLATIPVGTLLTAATAHGDHAQQNQGFHFKVVVASGLEKTFWVRCAAPAPSPSPTATPSPSASASPSPSASASPSPSPTSGGVGGVSATPTPTPDPTATPSPSGTNTTTTTHTTTTSNASSSSTSTSTVETQLANGEPTLADVPIPVTGTGAALLGGLVLCLGGLVTLLLTRTRRRPG
ncbi:MAG TPA: hypothetical protein VH134_00975 [Candidatus Dormibacteraeota bacterium]|nr:hypothetical protein [Candidatus Dormibacteraeota bacterium]